MSFKTRANAFKSSININWRIFNSNLKAEQGLFFIVVNDSRNNDYISNQDQSCECNTITAMLDEV